jgi:hypothetical protein
LKFCPVFLKRIKDLEKSSKLRSSLARIFERDSSNNANNAPSSSGSAGQRHGGSQHGSKEKAPLGPLGKVGKLVKGKSLPSLIL